MGLHPSDISEALSFLRLHVMLTIPSHSRDHNRSRSRHSLGVFETSKVKHLYPYKAEILHDFDSLLRAFTQRHHLEDIDWSHKKSEVVSADIDTHLGAGRFLVFAGWHGILASRMLVDQLHLLCTPESSDDMKVSSLGPLAAAR